MALSITSIRKEIEDRAKSQFKVVSFDGGVPAHANLVKKGGKIAPYVVLNMGDMFPGFSTSFAGTRGDDFRRPVRFFCVAADYETAQALYEQCIDIFLGFSPKYAGEMTKMPGGGVLTIQDDSGATEAFVASASFWVTIQILDIS